MTMAADFERRIREVVRLAERHVHHTTGKPVEPLPPAPSLGEREQALTEVLGVSHDEIELLWSVIAFAIEPRVAVPAQQLVFDPDTSGVPLAQHLAWRDLPEDRRRALAAVLDARHPMRELGLIVPARSGPVNVWTPLTVARRVIDYLRGKDELDPSLGLVCAEHLHCHLHQATEQRSLIERLRGWLGDRNAPTIVVEGAVGSGRATAIAAAAAPRRALTANFAAVPPSQANALLTALRREALLCDAIPILANLDELWARVPPGDERLLELAATIDRLAGPIAITTSGPGLELRSERRTLVRARWPLPDPAARRVLWQTVLGNARLDAQLDELAHRYALGPGGIAAAARSARHHAGERRNPEPTFADLVTGVQDNIAERLGDLARRVEVKQTWDELVLPDETHDEVRALIGRIRNAHLVLDRWNLRSKLPLGTGVAALFSGPPGTGKTMVAGLIAGELQLELYQVDLSRIVSKWVGETEKQLARVFEAAEAGHALLLFDEADALFAKRSAEVKSATDRYANLEVNYLLQRIESFRGVVILTTNLDASIDPALRRRLASHIVFALPDEAVRVQLWREMLGTGAPVEAVDVHRLAAEFEHLTGANIRNAVLAAAFLAAEEGRSITDHHLHRAARAEYRAMGRGLARQEPSGL